LSLCSGCSFCRRPRHITPQAVVVPLITIPAPTITASTILAPTLWIHTGPKPTAAESTETWSSKSGPRIHCQKASLKTTWTSAREDNQKLMSCHLTHTGTMKCNPTSAAATHGSSFAWMLTQILVTSSTEASQALVEASHRTWVFTTSTRRSL